MNTSSQWHPWTELKHEVNHFRRELDRLCRRWSVDMHEWPPMAFVNPPVNVWEDDDFIYADAEVPGLKLPELEITVTADSRLTIKGKRTAAPEKIAWHRQERETGCFERTIELPTKVDSNNVEARLENGILFIKMSKSPAVKPKKIPVKAG